MTVEEIMQAVAADLPELPPGKPPAADRLFTSRECKSETAWKPKASFEVVSET